METNTTVTYAYPPQPVVPVPVQTQVVSSRQYTYGAEKSVGLGVSEIILRIICLIFCLATLGAAAAALSAVNDVDDYFNDFGSEYEHADRYRGAAGWLVFVGIAAIIYHIVMIFIRILYFTAKIGHTFGGYSFTNAVLCVIFGLAFLAGVVGNAVFASNNQDVYDDTTCASYDLDFCNDLERLYISEAAAASCAFFSMILFIPLFIITLASGIRKMQESSNQRSSNWATAPSAPYVHLPNNY